jgi:hypothetical protein
MSGSTLNQCGSTTLKVSRCIVTWDMNWSFCCSMATACCRSVDPPAPPVIIFLYIYFSRGDVVWLFYGHVLVLRICFDLTTGLKTQKNANLFTFKWHPKCWQFSIFPHNLTQLALTGPHEILTFFWRNSNGPLGEKNI